MSKVEGFDELTNGQLKALCIKLGGVDSVNAILRDEMSVEIKEIIKKLFDKNGRCIPQGLKSSVCDPNTSFKLIQMKIDYAVRLARLVNFFPKGTNFLSANEFQTRSEALIGQLKQDNLLSNLLKGVYLPVCFPQLIIDDYGKCLEEVFLLAISASYEDLFSGRKFYNHRKGELEKKVSIVEGSRHNKLPAKMAEEPVVGIQFFPLQGFSINADREQVKILPESILLSGAIDITVAMTMYPDVLVRDFNTPGYDCAAVSWQSTGYSLFFEAYDGKLVFYDYGYLGPAHDSYSGGLLFLG